MFSAVNASQASTFQAIGQAFRLPFGPLRLGTYFAFSADATDLLMHGLRRGGGSLGRIVTKNNHNNMSDV